MVKYLLDHTHSRISNPEIKVSFKSRTDLYLFKLEGVKDPNAFNRACRNGDIELVKFIHEKLPQQYLEQESISKKTSLWFSLKNEHVLRYLLEDLKFPIERVVQDEKDILLYAATFHDTSVFGFVYLKEKYKLNMQILNRTDKNGKTVIDLAHEVQNSHLVNFLRFPQLQKFNI